MEKFKIEGYKLLEIYKPSTPLKQIFSDIEQDLYSQNKVVCQYIVNGKELSEDQEIESSDMELQQISTLEYMAEEEVVLVSSVIEGWVDAIPELISNLELLADRIIIEGLPRNLNDLVVVVNNIKFLLQSCESIKQYIGFNGWDDISKKLLASLVEINRSLKENNAKNIAEVIEYEVNHLLQSSLNEFRKVKFKQSNNKISDSMGRVGQGN